MASLRIIEDGLLSLQQKAMTTVTLCMILISR
jgi:hypothetical protein